MFTINKRLLPAMNALKDGMTAAEATDIYFHTRTMLIFNMIMFTFGLVKTRLGAIDEPSGEKTKTA